MGAVQVDLSGCKDKAPPCLGGDGAGGLQEPRPLQPEGVVVAERGAMLGRAEDVQRCHALAVQTENFKRGRNPQPPRHPGSS